MTSSIGEKNGVGKKVSTIAMLGPLLAMPSGQGLNMTLLAILKVNRANWLLVLEKNWSCGKMFLLLTRYHYWSDNIRGYLPFLGLITRRSLGKVWFPWLRWGSTSNCGDVFWDHGGFHMEIHSPFMNTLWLWLTVRHGKIGTIFLIGKPSISMGHGLTMANC